MHRYPACWDAKLVVEKISHSAVGGVAGDQFDCGKEHAYVNISQAQELSSNLKG